MKEYRLKCQSLGKIGRCWLHVLMCSTWRCVQARWWIVKLLGKLHSEMSKASHGKKRETHNLTLFVCKLVQPDATFKAPYPFLFRQHILDLKTPFNKSDIRCILVVREELLRHFPHVYRHWNCMRCRCVFWHTKPCSGHENIKLSRQHPGHKNDS